ncbi:hypothetical protein ACLB2K_031804 [Fragaria x ananassa]
MQFPHTWPRSRLAHVGLIQPTRHDTVPRGGPQVAQESLAGCSAAACGTCDLPHAAEAADDLLTLYKSETTCRPSAAVLRGNTHCRLALSNLPDEVYEREWDLIMIDGPQGWFAEAPGRMSVIFSVAVVARKRRGPGSTHVFLHDVDRKVEKAFAEEFLCRKYLVNAVGRLWHFVIPSAVDVNDTDDASFC